MHMINYLARCGYLTPTYFDSASEEKVCVQGRVRYYSYRDLVIARIIQRLRESGVRIGRLKQAVVFLKKDEAWGIGGDRQESDPIKWLIYDGKNVLFRNEDGYLNDLRRENQCPFSFVIGLDGMKNEVMKLVDVDKLEFFTMENMPMRLQPCS